VAGKYRDGIDKYSIYESKKRKKRKKEKAKMKKET